ncbi:radical SAM protein [Clostridia bacterium]|nr:radical SAM protein [Clostridia bacterium]GHV33341.1 radical SAM protein [Clostridia bacterium]
MHYADYKTILSTQGGMNLYRGCTHGCIYCDARSRCYQMNHDFEDIEVKRNAPKILEEQIRRKRKPCMIATGAMCDPYIPLESELRLTRKCLELIERYGFGLAIQTKSARILRDLDVLTAINRKTKCVVEMTLTTFDEDLCRVVEPNVSTTAERFAALEAVRDAGVPTVVWLSPFLPFINDTEENLRGLLDYCVRAKVKAILCFGFGMTLRDGNREYFYAKLDEDFPGLKERYVKTFGNSYECRSPNNDKLWAILQSECCTHGIMYGTDNVFAYMREFESKSEQLSLF